MNNEFYSPYRKNKIMQLAGKLIDLEKLHKMR